MKKYILTIVAVLTIFAGFTTAQESEKPKKPRLDLHAAAAVGNIKQIESHIYYGSNLNAQEPTRKSTPLITAIVFGQDEAALKLIEAGADLNFTNSEGSTALHTAAFFCRKDIVAKLIEKGADKSVKNQWQSTALQTLEIDFKTIKPIYESAAKGLKSIGVEIDMERIQKTRPIIAEMLK